MLLNCRHSQQQSSVKCQKELKEQNFHLRKCFDQLYKETNLFFKDSLALPFRFIAAYCHCNLTPFTALCAISVCMSVLTYFAHILFMFYSSLSSFLPQSPSNTAAIHLDVLQIFPLSKLTVGLQPHHSFHSSFVLHNMSRFVAIALWRSGVKKTRLLTISFNENSAQPHRFQRLITAKLTKKCESLLL